MPKNLKRHFKMLPIFWFVWGGMSDTKKLTYVSVGGIGICEEGTSSSIAVNTTVKRSSAISKNVSFWAGQIPAGQTSPKGTISEMAARAFYCCLYAMVLAWFCKFFGYFSALFMDPLYSFSELAVELTEKVRIVIINLQA